MLGWRWGDWALLAANPATSPQSSASATPPTATPAVQPLLQPPAAPLLILRAGVEPAGICRTGFPISYLHTCLSIFTQLLLKNCPWDLFYDNLTLFKDIVCAVALCVLETPGSGSLPLTGGRFKAQLRLLHLTTHNYHHDTDTYVTSSDLQRHSTSNVTGSLNLRMFFYALIRTER